jgi:hypothetical protein
LNINILIQAIFQTLVRLSKTDFQTPRIKSIIKTANVKFQINLLNLQRQLVKIHEGWWKLKTLNEIRFSQFGGQYRLNTLLDLKLSLFSTLKMPFNTG